ncbi:MAG: S9 family peptidase [Planctomycetaceae bacterium]|nr:S9 family peptidase [Planctomycetaceae bacterium]
MTRTSQSCVVLIVIFLQSIIVQASDEKAKAAQLTVDRIYNSREFESQRFGGRWLKDGTGYVTLEKSTDTPGSRDLVRHDPVTGITEIMVAAADLIPAGKTTPLLVQGYAFSKDRALILIYTNSKRVWRRNTRGDYWVLDRSNHELKKLGGDAQPSTLMFAKIAPTSDRVAYVRDRNIYVENLHDGSIQQVTKTESDEIINGTFDWVYEEELGLRDGFRWSPNGKSIAFWQINTTGVRKFPLINNTNSFYPRITWFAYPKTGEVNAECRVGVIDLEKNSTRWIDVPGDVRNNYIARMEWAESSTELILQQLNRLQNTNRVMLASALSGKAATILTEKDDAWVNVNDELFWNNQSEKFTWISERNGWRQVYLAPRQISDLKQTEPRKVTSGDFDVIRLLHVDEKSGLLYFIASPGKPAQRYLYQVKLDGSDLKRLTPNGTNGWNDYAISPNGQWAFHTHSSANAVPTTQLIKLPLHETIRALTKNEKLKERIGKLARRPTEFLRVDIGNEIELEAWCIKPPDFDAKKKYPLLIYVYGEPAGQTVTDRWGGSSYLWHLMLAQRGYIVMSIDNRGTAAPRGREFRKCVYRKIGIIAPQDQAAALKAILKKWPFIDSKRIGIWGWSGGGSSTLQAMFKYPGLYKTGISIAPVPNQRYYDTIYQERYMGLPKDNVEGFRDGSAINFVKNLKGNLLLVHGTGDDNCHYQTTEKLINELIKYNKPFTMMAYPNRTHSIREGKNTTRHLRHLMTNYLLTNLPAGAK